jgi:hypothetical protein
MHMRYITMGSEAFPTLLFIHGLSATAESCYGSVFHQEKSQKEAASAVITPACEEISDN